MAINTTLQRQVQQSLGVGNQAQLDEFLAAVAVLARLSDVTPMVRQGLLGLQHLLTQVDSTYTDYQGRAEMLGVSLGNVELGSQQMVNVNAQLRDESANHQQTSTLDRAEVTMVASDLTAKSAPPLPLQFARVLDSVDGDLDMFVVIAEKAVHEFRRTAERLDDLVSAADLPGLTREAHKLCSVWALYAKAGEEGMAVQLEKSAKDGQEQMALALAGQLVLALRDAAQSLSIWHGQTQGQKHQ